MLGKPKEVLVSPECLIYRGIKTSSGKALLTSNILSPKFEELVHLGIKPVVPLPDAKVDNKFVGDICTFSAPVYPTKKSTVPSVVFSVNCENFIFAIS